MAVLKLTDGEELYDEVHGQGPQIAGPVECGMSRTSRSVNSPAMRPRERLLWVQAV